MKFKENTDFLRISLKIGDFSRFLTYVNFSLCAKFNRFFIILGGPPWIYQEIHRFQKGPKNVIFRGFSWKSGIFEIFGKKALFIKARNPRKIVDFSYYAGKGWVFKYLKFLDNFERKLIVFPLSFSKSSYLRRNLC